MHELSIAESIVAAVTEKVSDTPIRRIRVQVGKLSGVVPDALEFCFELACTGTALEGAELDIVSSRRALLSWESFVPSSLLIDVPDFVCPELLAGPAGIVTLAGEVEADVVLSAIVGGAGLLPTMAAIKSGKSIALGQSGAQLLG